MKRYLFKNARFVKSATQPIQYPSLKDKRGKLLPEIAVAGRSNVGKSTLLNHLFQSKGLVKASSTPGKTQLISFFTLNEELAFVDLPGYGYAKVAQETAKKWGPMIESYLSERAPLKLILFLVDIRRTPNEDDKRFLQWAVFHNKPIVLVLTKVDKVSKGELKSSIQHILNEFNADNLHHVCYSATKNVGRNELIGMIVEALDLEELPEASWDC